MIGIYELNPSTSEFVGISGGNFTPPIVTQITPRGKSSAKKLWIRNDDLTRFYADISISPVGIDGVSLPSGLSIKMKKGTRQPLVSEWEVAQDQIPNFIDIGSAAAGDMQYYPFWIEIKASGSLAIGENRIQLAIGYTEGLVA